MGRIRKLDFHGLRAKDMLHQRGHVLSHEPGNHVDSDTIYGILCRTKGQRDINTDAFYDWFSIKENRQKIRSNIFEKTSVQLPIFNEFFIDTTQVTETIYAKTFEWYVSELLVQEMRFIASGFRVFLSGAPSGGDYDVVGFSANELIYIEAKSGHPRNITADEMTAFVARARFLAADISIIYIDYENVAKNLFNFKDLAAATEASRLYQIKDKQSGARVYYPLDSNVYILENQSGGSVVNNLRFLMRTHYALAKSHKQRIVTNPELLNVEQFDVSWLS